MSLPVVAEVCDDGIREVFVLESMVNGLMFT